MQTIKYGRVIGVGDSKLESVFNAASHDPVLAEEILMLVSRLGYETDEQVCDDSELTAPMNPVSNFESF